MRFEPTLTLVRNFIAVRVHGGHDVDASAVDQLRDLRVAAVVRAQVLDQV